MKKYFFLIVLNAFVVLGYAQNADEFNNLTISGKLIDVYTGDFLPFAHIYNRSQKNGTISDYYGFFKLALNEHDTLRISFVGYKTLIITNINNYKTGNEYLEFQLTPEIYTLDEVIINPLGSYEQFKWKVVNLDLPESQQERLTREVNFLAKKEIRKVQNNQPRYVYNNQTLGVSGGFDITGLSAIFTKLEEAETESNHDKLLSQKYNRQMIHRISGFKGAKLDSFVIFCNQNTNFNYLVSEFDITKKVFQLLDEFNFESDTL